MSSIPMSAPGRQGNPEPKKAQRPSAEPPREGFLGGHPLDVFPDFYRPEFFKFPLEAAPETKTRPVPIRPDKDSRIKMPDMPRELRKDLARERARRIAEEMARLKKARQLAKLTSGINGLGGAFMLGWDIGTIIWGDPFDPYVGATMPDGWHAPYQILSNMTRYFIFTDCGSSKPIEGYYNRSVSNCVGTTGWNAAPNTSQCFLSFSPTTNIAAAPDNLFFCQTNPNIAASQVFGVSARDAFNRRESVHKWDLTTPGWKYGDPGLYPAGYEPMVGVRPATRVELAPAHSEFPELFPLTQPIQMPQSQTWDEAIPEPWQQAQPMPNGFSVEPGAMPLAPFPVVIGHMPPGATPPPTQVIEIPPPAPPGGSSPIRVVGPTYSRKPNKNKRERPRKRTREKKLSVRSVANKAWLVLNLATEAFDFIDALHEGLSDECKAKGPSIDYGKKGGGKPDPYAKALAIYKALAPGSSCKMDWDGAVQAFINNQIEDTVVGLLGMAGTQANKVSGAATGGGGAIYGRPGKFAGEAQEAQGEKADKLPIPTVSFDSEAGTWVIEIPLKDAGLGEDLTIR